MRAVVFSRSAAAADLMRFSCRSRALNASRSISFSNDCEKDELRSRWSRAEASPPGSAPSIWRRAVAQCHAEAASSSTTPDSIAARTRVRPSPDFSSRGPIGSFVRGEFTTSLSLSHRSIASRSYVQPSSATTGSTTRAKEIGHVTESRSAAESPSTFGDSARRSVAIVAHLRTETGLGGPSAGDREFDSNDSPQPPTPPRRPRGPTAADPAPVAARKTRLLVCRPSRTDARRTPGLPAASKLDLSDASRRGRRTRPPTRRPAFLAPRRPGRRRKARATPRRGRAPAPSVHFRARRGRRVLAVSSPTRPARARTLILRRCTPAR
mmetsp:Transcript_13302/g.40991  ORF Transcript_13302/g.40991 Transcript_13302/m.40991 type:complete len:324 (+) Transcript_13302:344-1315(+)